MMNSKKGSIIDMYLKHNPHDSKLVVPLPLAQGQCESVKRRHAVMSTSRIFRHFTIFGNPNGRGNMHASDLGKAIDLRSSPA